MVLGEVKEEIFECPEKKDEEIVVNAPVTIKIDFNSISSFLRKYPDAPMKMWESAQRKNPKKGYLQLEDVNNFLHDILRKWWEHHNPRERITVTKTQTATAVEELRKAVLDAESEDEVKDDQNCYLSKQTWRQFVENMKRGKDTSETAPRITEFESFAGKVFAPLSNSGAKKGLEIVYQSVPDTLTETPIQKYRRLKAEIAEFSESLKEFPEDISADPDAPTAASISQDLSKMRAMFSEPFRNLLDETERGQPRKGGEYLYSELNSHFAKARAEEAVEPAVFSLNSEAMNACDETETLRKLDDRLSKLERIFGQGETTDIEPNSDVMTSIEYLTSQLDVLGEPEKVKVLETKVKSLNGQLDLLEKTLGKKPQPTVGMSKRTAKLLEMMPLWDKASTQLPIVVDRLKNLKELNVEAVGVSEQVTKIKEQQETLSATLEEDKNLLQQVFETLSSNVEEIYASVKSLDERIVGLTNH